MGNKPEFVISSTRKLTPKRIRELQAIAEYMTVRGTNTVVDMDSKRARVWLLRWKASSIYHRLIRR